MPATRSGAPPSCCSSRCRRSEGSSAGAGECAQWAGLAGAVACIVLSGSPVRPRDSEPPTLFSLRLHTLIGWAALIAIVVHVGGLLLADRTVVQYLKPTAPLYQFAGIAAVLVLLGLIFTSVAGARRRLWRSHRGFQATHVILACALSALIAVHVVVTALLIQVAADAAPGSSRPLSARSSCSPRARRPSARRPSGDRPDAGAGVAAPTRRQFVFGRHSTLIVGGVVGSVRRPSRDFSRRRSERRCASR